MKLKRCNWCGKILWPWQAPWWLPMHYHCAKLVDSLQKTGHNDYVRQCSYICQKKFWE